MNRGLKAIVLFLLNKKYIGNKHFPEKKLIVSRTKYLKPKERKEFEKEYKEFRNNFLLRSKKRTGKSSDWHISLDPKKLKDL